MHFFVHGPGVGGFAIVWVVGSVSSVGGFYRFEVSPCAIAAFPRFFGAAGGNRTWGCCARGESRHQ
eukprot:295344-Amphidinium_carterae.1